MRINSSGFLGIQTASPSWPLTVKVASSGTVGVFAFDGTFAGTGEANIGLRFYNGGSASDTPQVFLAGYGTTNYTGNFAVRVMQGGTYPNTIVERFTVSGTNGYVGINNTAPTTNLTIGTGGGGSDLGVLLSRGVATNFYQAHDGTKTFIGGVDNTQTFAKVGTLTGHDLAIITGNGSKIYVSNANNGVTIGSATAAPGSGLRVEGSIKGVSGFASEQMIAGYVASNYTGTRYWLLQNMTTGSAQAFNCQGDLVAASYSVWNNSRIFIRRTYASFTLTGSITGIAASGVTVSIVDITYGGDRYIALKFAGGDPGISANLTGYLMDQMYVSGVPTFVNGTAGVTENVVVASYP
jgi:hypothetical protein